LAINSKQSPLIQWETDENGVRQAVQVTNEEIKIINNTTILHYKPSEYHRVILDNITIDEETLEFVEIGIKEKIDAINKYKVDYNTGIIFFHPTLDGFTLNVSQYYEEGLILTHVSRIYYRDANDVIVTLEEYLNSITEIVGNLNITGLNIKDLYVTLTALEAAHPIGSAGDAYAVGVESSNVIYVWSETLSDWINIGSLKGDKGDTGSTGTTGSAGADGNDGATPNITIGTITTVSPTTPASATITGTTPDLVLNMSIPKGVDGAGSGDMSRTTYDPNNKNADAFNVDNHISGITNKVYTATEQTKVSNLSGINTGNETTTTIGTLINGSTAKSTPVNADMVGLMDSDASNVLKKLSWANIKATLKTYFDTLYALASHTHTSVNITDFASTVLATILTGLSTASTTVVTASHSILQAIGFLQAQITALTTTVSGKSPSASPTFTGTVVLPSTTTINSNMVYTAGNITIANTDAGTLADGYIHMKY
jgi:hypothetical protein